MKTRLNERIGRFRTFGKVNHDVDLLPSWSDRNAKKSIVDFVSRVTDEDGDDYIEPEDRIATIDNDGTLWSEHPIYIQFQFVIDRIKVLATQHPEWKDKQPYKGILEGDLNSVLAGGKKAIVELLMATHAGMTTFEFELIVKKWIAKATHPHFNKPYTECIYQPMLELMEYLRVNKFKTYIVSGGGVEFMRPWVEKVYNVPPEQVIGSSIKTSFEIQDGKPVLVRLPAVNFVDDKAGKPVGIYQHIGRIPIAAFGNSDGDFEMLEWVTSAEGPRFGMLLHHDDAVREFAYDSDTVFGKLVRGLKEAPQRGWTVVSMKDDWKKVFPE